MMVGADSSLELRDIESMLERYAMDNRNPGFVDVNKFRSEV